MNIDWNWFFSTFSQSAAALLGIIGAFTISRLIGIDEKANILTSDFEDLKITYNKIRDSLAIRNYSWVNRTYIIYNDDIIKLIQKGEFEKLSEDKILEKLYAIDCPLYKDDRSILEAFNQIYKVHKPKEELKRKLGEAFVVKSQPLLFNIPPKGIWNEISNERDLINKLLIDANELIRKFNKHLESLQNFSSSLNTIKMIVLILIVSFPFTVIYPLHFLPVVIGKEPSLTWDIILIIKGAATLKNILLVIFLVSVEGIFLYFLYLIRQIKLRLSNLEKQHLEQYRNINSYCEYYREINSNYITNQ